MQKHSRSSNRARFPIMTQLLIIKWMRFLSAESREDFEKMAGEDTYINEAYEVLQKLSADERKRLEYEARQKAILDYNSQMSSAREEGMYQNNRYLYNRLAVVFCL